MEINFPSESIYVQLIDEQTVWTKELIDGVFADIGKDGKLIGVKILHIKKSTPTKGLTQEELNGLAKQAEAALIKDGDPFNGDDWAMMQVVSQYIKEHS